MMQETLTKTFNKGEVAGSRLFKIAMMLAAVCGASAALADDPIYLTANASRTSAFLDQPWSEKVETEEEAALHDYLVHNGRTFQAQSGTVVPAKTFSFGTSSSRGIFYSYYGATFTKLYLVNGLFYNHMSAQTIAGPTEVLSPAANPFVIRSNGERAVGFTFPGAFSSPETAGLITHSFWRTPGEKDHPDGFFLELSGDTSAYLGSIAVTSQYWQAGEKVGQPLGAELRLGHTAFGGSIRLEDGAKLTCAQGITIKDLAFKPGSVLNASSDKTITVTGAFSAEGPVEVSVPELATAVSAPVTNNLLTVPFACALSEQDFKLATEDDLTGKTAAKLQVAEDAVAGTKTLQAVYCPVIQMDEKLSGGGNTTHAARLENNSLNTPSCWADDKVPHADAYYYVKRIDGTTAFVTPYDLENTCNFPGEGLKMGESSAFTLQGKEFYVKKLRFIDDSKIYGLYDPATIQTLSFGQMTIAAEKTVTTELRGGSGVILKGPISGDETTTIMLNGASGSSSICQTINTLDGDNSDFKGKINVYTAANRGTDTRGYTTLRLLAGNNLGGARSEFAYDAFSLNNMGLLDVCADVTLDEPTRGLYFDSSAKLTDSKAKANCVRIDVEVEAHTLAVKQTITLNGTIRKQGAGTLALGGALKFWDGETITDTPQANIDLHALHVTEGTLKPISARSMDGLAIVFSNDATKASVALAIDAATTDEELETRGFVNLKTDEPLKATTKTGKINVVLDNLPEKVSGTLSVPICTVRADVADTVLGYLTTQKKVGQWRVALSKSAAFELDGQQAVTIKADVTGKRGLAVIFW